MLLPERKKIIVQARSGSTRLPDKMNKLFYSDATLLDTVLSGLLIDFPADDIIVATSNSSNDDLIIETGKKHHVLTFRGDENNVLLRFLDAATAYNLTHVIRVCADNPFLDNSFIKDLIYQSTRGDFDYISFQTTKGLPSIRTHFGFFAELISVAALSRITHNSNDREDLEHVTRYVYNYPEHFKIKWIPIPKTIERADIRLTIDTEEDFLICQQIYRHFITHNKQTSPDNIIAYLDSRADLKQIIKNQILRNQK